MLAIRLQRLGRKSMPVYRIAVQESQRHPSSGRVVAYVGSYNPHTKESKVDVEKVSLYLKNGAQPTPRVVRILAENKVALPAWVKTAEQKKFTTRHPEKLRKNQPKEEVVAEAPVETAEVEAPAETPEATEEA